MGIKLNREAYCRLIGEDMIYLQDHAKPGLERDHIMKVLIESINLQYPPPTNECPKCHSNNIRMFDSDNDQCTNCGYWAQASAFSIKNGK